MNKRIINEINQIKSIMGLKESEVDEQVVKSAIDGLKKGIKSSLNKNSESSTNTEDDLGNYNGKPVSQILKDIDEMNSRYGKIDVNGETLHFGVATSKSQNISDSKASSNARQSFGPGVLKNTATVIKEVFFENDEFKTYILMKTF